MVAAVDNRTEPLTIRCRICGLDHVVIIAAQDFWDWNAGVKYIQEAFPYLTSGERELLLTGTCGKCFQKLYEEEQ